jgi:hypothetical protein
MLTLARDLIAQWLASTAKKHGYVPSKGKGAAKVPKAAQGRQTYTVALKEWVALAEFIAGMTPPIFVPNKLTTLLDTTISLRQSYAEDVSEMLADSGEKRKADDQHTFFLNVLKRVRDILGSRLPADRTSRQSPKNTEEIINLSSIWIWRSLLNLSNKPLKPSRLLLQLLNPSTKPSGRRILRRVASPYTCSCTTSTGCVLKSLRHGPATRLALKILLPLQSPLTLLWIWLDQ